ncbi:MAG: IS1380 family transposase [Candidatus Riflebacteria bacterium]|nr:IS1380 family transposase [Candidatus Riflebacteria bacterium]
MNNISSPLLPFKLGLTDDKITANAGLALFGEFLHSQRFSKVIDDYVKGFKSNHSYKPSEFVVPLLLMLHGGGRYIEDVREIASDEALLQLLQITAVPSSSAIGDWLRFIGDAKGGLSGFSRYNQSLLKRGLKNTGSKEFTLDIDATQIIGWKADAEFTYKGEKGYMPIVGHIAETGMVIHDEFRDGNVSPGTRNLQFIKQCCAKMPRGKRIKRFRADGATYQSAVFNWCENNGIKFAIGGRMDVSVKTIISELDESCWQKYQETSSIIRITHCMNHTDKAFDLIIIRRPWQPDLLDPHADDSKRYVLVATNIKGKPESIVRWYNRRGEASENRIKELKIGFGMEYMPCGTTKANAVYFKIGVLAYNLFKLFKMAAMPAEWAKHTVQTIRWKFYQAAGKLAMHAGQLWFKVRRSCFNIFEEVRARIREFAMTTA